MRKALLLCCIILPAIAYCNEIDKLQTKADLIHFLIKRIDKRFKHELMLVDDTTRTKSEFGHNTFYKIDFDKNGLTDLIVDGEERFVIMDLGNNNYTVKFIDRGSFLTDKPTIIAIDSVSTIPKIIILHKKYLQQYSGETVDISDTLIYRFGSLVEYNTDTLTDFDFQKLVFTTTRCFGRCPVFKMEINADKTAIYNAIEFNKKQGRFEVEIPQQYFSKLVSILQYINPSKLDSSYTVGWTDDQSVTTEITFNGKTKKIEDYGEIGRYGLTRLYNLLFSLRNKFDSEED